MTVLSKLAVLVVLAAIAPSCLNASQERGDSSLCTEAEIVEFAELVGIQVSNRLAMRHLNALTLGQKVAIKTIFEQVENVPLIQVIKSGKEMASLEKATVFVETYKFLGEANPQDKEIFLDAAYLATPLGTSDQFKIFCVYFQEAKAELLNGLLPKDPSGELTNSWIASYAIRFWKQDDSSITFDGRASSRIELEEYCDKTNAAILLEGEQRRARIQKALKSALE